MTSNSFTIEGRYELLALHRALMEARYCDIANDLDVSVSPILARMHRDVVAAIIKAESDEGLEVAAWFKWLEMRVERREWAVSLGRARDSSRWGKLHGDERREFVRDLLSPFLLTPELVDLFIQEVGRD